MLEYYLIVLLSSKIKRKVVFNYMKSKIVLRFEVVECLVI